MKIYFSGSISGGRDNVAIYQRLVAHLQMTGHLVLSSHVADPDVLEREKDVPPRVVYERDVKWIEACDAMICEVSTPSLGVGYEYGYAVQLGKPVLCLYRSGLRMSKMITGNPAVNLTVTTYASETELAEKLDAFLKNLTRRQDDKTERRQDDQ
jgi:nucleoside 2-deoxyribosyltransferase